MYSGLRLENIRCEWQPLKTFWTGSSYIGTWNNFGMSGYGIYTYANGYLLICNNIKL